MPGGTRDDEEFAGDDLTDRLDDLFAVLGHFPIPAEVFAADGGSLFINPSFTEVFGIGSAQIVGRYNVLEDRYLREGLGLAEHLERGFAGQPDAVHDIRVPVGELEERYHHRLGLADGVELYQDIACLPLTDRRGQVGYVVVLFLTRSVYEVHQAVVRARNHLEQHWLEPFALDAVAAAAGMSRSQLSRLFRHHLGTTPYRYYQGLKIEQLKTALAEPGLSIGEAFARCGVDYAGGFAAAFKRSVGMSPSAYRRTLTGVCPPSSSSCRSPSLHRDEQWLFRIADLLPIPIQIFRPNGDAAFINRAVLQVWNVRNVDPVLAGYNLLTDPLVNDRHGLRSQVSRAFAGETVMVRDARLPLDTFWEAYQKDDDGADTKAIYTDILNFPIRDGEGRFCHLMSVFFTRRVYRGRPEVVRVREHLEQHWQEGFDARVLARLANLSGSQLTRLFRQELGTTPYRYHRQLRLERLRTALQDPGVSIAQACASCGLGPQSNVTRLFKQQVGMTPSQYRRSLAQR